MKHNATIKKLLKRNRGIFRTLHNVWGFDFEKPFNTYHINGNFTVNQILKLSHEKHTQNVKILLLTCDASHNWRKDLHAVTVDHLGKIDIDFKIPWETGGRAIDTFYRKSDFEETRKSKTAETFIIFQDREYLIDTIKKPRDLSKRYKYIPMEHGEKMGDGHGSSWYYRIKLKTLDENGATFEYYFDALARYNGYKTKNIFDIIDKSGYLLTIKREDLKRRAKALKAQREKDAYNKTENGAKVEELARAIETAKKEILKSLEEAKTSTDIDRIGKKIYFDFSRILRAFERYKERTEAKTYNSISEAENAFNNIIADLEKMNKNEG
ncbi:MAG: hypothetical protein J6J71_04490 [Prevotella sp.]|nr:hypothetical protein [Prevotella sp.]